MTSVDIINHNLSPISTKINIPEEELLKEFDDTFDKIIKTRNKKIKEFAMLLRHFLLITVSEINFLLFKNNKSFRIDFKDETYNYFIDENKVSCKNIIYIIMMVLLMMMNLPNA